jgi:hypothetical protein
MKKVSIQTALIEDCQISLESAYRTSTVMHAGTSGFLGAFAKLRKAAIGFIMYVNLSVLMEQLGSHWTDLHEILILEYFLKICRESSIKI